ncbi:MULTISPECIES: hypothetical protein [Enterococcus]|jgi:hypothetical protein|uniref:hypothetical protein n=1 Tax=Enterococcus TaxID=1350 RepID=UPI001F074509|nr:MULTISPECIES: hypothetical protein [Enterococcus]
MLLQIDKFLKSDVGTDKEAVLRTDIIEGVNRTNRCEGFLMVHFNDGTVHSFSIDEEDNSFNLDTAEEFKGYLISQVWLLNNEGKTLRKLL